jgi:hypothetical protein
MSTEPTEEIADQIVDRLGAGPGLVVAMRLLLRVGQTRPDDPVMLEAVKDALSAIKRIGAAAGTFDLA